MRINKFLAECGVASRRNSEKFVTEGRIKINGKVVTDLATDINPFSDIVLVDGVRTERSKNHIYILINKPKGVVTTTSDDLGRKTVLDLIDIKDRRIFPIGRLDYETEGLLILTTDGDLANRLMHPSHEVPKTYIANIEGTMLESELAVLRAGVVIEGVKTAKARVKLIGMNNGFSRVELTITEGRNRQVRRMFEEIGRKVDFLKRTKIGDIKLGGLFRGESREMTEKEIEYLKNI